MIRVILVFIAIVGVLLAGNWLLDHPGTIVIDLPGFFSIDWSFALGATFLAIALACVLVGYLILSLVIGSPWRIARHQRRGKRERGFQAISMGMVAVAAGDTIEARRQAGRARKLLPEQPMTTLLAAQSAQLDGDVDAAQGFLTALAAQPDAAFLGHRGLWMQAMKDGRTRDALHYAEAAHELQPNSGWVLDSLFALQTQLGQWDKAQATVTQMAKNKAHPADQLKRDLALVNLERSRAALAAGDGVIALQAATAAHKNLPGFVPAAAVLAEAQIANKRRGKAEKVLQDAWRLNPHPMLAAAYPSVVDQVAVDKQLNLARTLAALKPSHPESRILVAKFAMAAQKYTEARQSLEPLANAEPTPRICRMMAEIEMAANQDATAARDWIARSATAAPDTAWVCQETGAVQADWSAVCAESKRFDTLEWRVPHHLEPAMISLLSAQSAATNASMCSDTSNTNLPIVLDAVAEPVSANS
jgi:HemY protein